MTELSAAAREQIRENLEAAATKSRGERSGPDLCSWSPTGGYTHDLVELTPQADGWPNSTQRVLVCRRGCGFEYTTHL